MIFMKRMLAVTFYSLNISCAGTFQRSHTDAADAGDIALGKADLDLVGVCEDYLEARDGCLSEIQEGKLSCYPALIRDEYLIAGSFAALKRPARAWAYYSSVVNRVRTTSDSDSVNIGRASDSAAQLVQIEEKYSANFINIQIPPDVSLAIAKDPGALTIDPPNHTKTSTLADVRSACGNSEHWTIVESTANSRRILADPGHYTVTVALAGGGVWHRDLVIDGTPVPPLTVDKLDEPLRWSTIWEPCARGTRGPTLVGWCEGTAFFGLAYLGQLVTLSKDLTVYAPQLDLVNRSESNKGAKFGIVGITREFKGFDLGALAITKEDLYGLQIGGLVSYTGGTLKGAQLGTVNVVGKSAAGGQLGVINWAGQGYSGVQIGLFNYDGGASTREGVQLGMINYDTASPSVQIGVLNIAKGMLPFSLLCNVPHSNSSRFGEVVCMLAQASVASTMLIWMGNELNSQSLRPIGGGGPNPVLLGVIGGFLSANTVFSFVHIMGEHK